MSSADGQAIDLKRVPTHLEEKKPSFEQLQRKAETKEKENREKKEERSGAGEGSGWDSGEKNPLRNKPSQEKNRMANRRAQ